MAKILIIEDDTSILLPLEDNLKLEGYETASAVDGNQGLNMAHEGHYDCIILDIMLPKLNGLEVCRQLRQDKNMTPILMLTAKSQEIDKVLGLELGADDYIVKPFSFRELLARVRAALRRIGYDRRSGASDPRTNEEIAVVGQLAIDRRRHQVTRRGEEVALSQREYDLLIALLDAGGAVVQRGDLLDKVWGEAWIGDPRTLDVHIRWLREKLEDTPGQPVLIRTVRGAGYRLVSPDELDDV